MEDNTNLDFKLIAEDCGLFSETDYNVLTSRIDALKDKYCERDLIKIYNYMLLNAQNPDIIMYLIHCVDMYRDSSSLEVLVDILLLSPAILDAYSTILAIADLSNCGNSSCSQNE